MKFEKSVNYDENETALFSKLSDRWWDKQGPFKALHHINPVRLKYIGDRCGLKGKKVIDVGCGGGLLSEAMAEKGAQVTGIDMDRTALAAADEHKKRSGLDIGYRPATVEQLAETDPAAYDVVTCMELLEHVPDPASVVSACSRLLRPGGDVFFATVNRTLAARLLVILVSEHLLGIVPKGTHRWEKFIRPGELKQWGKESGLKPENLSGLRYIPFLPVAALCRSTSMNYLMHFRKGE